MTGQTSLDLRAGIAALAASETAPQAPAPSRSAPRRSSGLRKAGQPREFRVSTGQRNMIRAMFFERYPEGQAEVLFGQIDFDALESRDDFQTLFQALKDVPRLPKEAPASVPVPEVVPARDLMEGVFTVEFEDGGYRTLRVRRQSEDSGFKPGAMVVAFLDGPDNDNNYTGFAHVDEHGQVRIWKRFASNTVLAEAVKVLTGDQIACAKAFARRSTRCSFCRRPLTTPESLDAGWGEKCAQDRGLPWG